MQQQSGDEGGGSRERFRAGMRVGAGLAAASFLLAVSFGAVTQELNWGPIAPVICSLLVFSGSAQFALAAGLGAGGGPVVAVTAAALVNVRFVPMGVAVAPYLRGPRLRRALAGQSIVDGSWAAAHLGGGRFDRHVMFGASLVQWPAWVAGTAVGVVLAPDTEMLHTLGLDVLTPALFFILLTDEVRRHRAGRLPAAAAAVVSAGILLVASPGPALLGAAATALVALTHKAGQLGYVPDRRSPIPEAKEGGR